MGGIEEEEGGRNRGNRLKGREIGDILRRREKFVGEIEEEGGRKEQRKEMERGMKGH